MIQGGPDILNVEAMLARMAGDPDVEALFTKHRAEVLQRRQALCTERAAIQRDMARTLEHHAKVKAAALAKLHKHQAVVESTLTELASASRAMQGAEHQFDGQLALVNDELEHLSHPAIGNFLDELSELETQLRYSPIEDSLARVAELERLRSARLRARELTFLAIPDVEGALADLRATL